MSCSSAARRSRRFSSALHAVQVRELVEERRGHVGDVQRVALVEVVLAPEVHRLGLHLGLLAPRVPHRERAVDELAQDPVLEPHARHRDGLRPHRVGHRREHVEGGHDHVRAVAAQPPALAPRAGVLLAHGVAQPAHGLDVDALAVVRGRGREVGDGLAVAARGDEQVGRAVAQTRGLVQRAFDVLSQQRPAGRGHGLLGVEKGLVQPHRAHGERHRHVRRALGEQGELHAAAADVDQQRAPVAHGHRALHGHEHQPGLLDALDDVELDARLALRALHQQVGVVGLAHRAGGHRAVALHAVRAHHVAKAPQRVDGLGQRRGGETSREEDVMAEPHRGPLRGDLADLIRRVRLDHPEAHGVAADIDGSKPGHR